MSSLKRAITIIEHVLKTDFEDWVYEIEGPMNSAWTRQPGWTAELSYSSGQTGDLASDHEAFLEAFVSGTSSYKLEVWVDGEGWVLSARAKPHVLRVNEFYPGEWETRCLGLSSSQSHRSA